MQKKVLIQVSLYLLIFTYCIRVENITVAVNRGYWTRAVINFVK